MTKILSVFRHESWSKMQKQSPLWMQRSIMPLLNVLREYAVLILRPYLSVKHLTGESQGGPITITYASLGADHMFGLRLQDIVFVEEPEEVVESVPFWHLKKMINTSSSDLTFISATKYLIRSLSTKNIMILPHPLGQTLDVSGEWDDVVKRFHPKLRRHELRLIRKYGYEYTVSNDEKDFELFFHEMYLPSMKTRHHDLASIGTYQEAYQLFKHGILIMVKQENTYVSGGLSDIEPKQKIVHFRYVGVKNANQQLMQEGAQGAVYHAIIDWSHKKGYKAVDFQGTEPYLRKGILQHKKRWGAVVSIQGNRRVWLKINRMTPAVSQFMKNNPCIIINNQGGLQGLFFADEPDNVPAKTKLEWDKLCAIPGLDGYLIRSVEDLVDHST